MKQAVGSILKNIKAELERDPRILGLYLYGSQASGAANDNSDIDLGILLYPNTKVSLLDEGGLSTKLSKYGKVHMSILNNKSPLYRYKAIFPQKVIFCKNDGERADFEVSTYNEYFEMEPYLNEQYDASLEKAKARIYA